MERRSFLAFAGGALCLRAVPACAAPARALREIASPKGIAIGSIFSHAASEDERQLIRQHCDVVVTENALKPNWLYRALIKPGTLQSEKACGDVSPLQDKDETCLKLVDTTLDFAKASNLGIHGHPVYWAKHGLPGIEALDEDSYTAAWEAHIERLVAHVPDAVSWDVINEPFSKDLDRLRAGGSMALEADKVLGADWERLLDHYAFVIKTLRRVLEPHQKTPRLLLNEAELDGTGDAHQRKRALLPALLAGLESRHAKLDGVGLQCHLSMRSRPDGAATATFIRNLAADGYVAHISELDFRATCGTADSAEAVQASYVGDFLDQVLAEPSVKRLSFWGLSDENHVFTRDRRDDFAKLSPTLFGANRRPKAVFDRIVAAIEAAPER
ncbi:GH35 family endo-1,4-beta-xylanase [Rhodobacter viridis]|uniref:endo-1,4-beta-xylanase n=1 Tax=Rhodobacter viridis TaxID=1054202 RepID=A0A318TQ70_9RHOB|nr:endo-1,4-beta-xylanase [Rhodobacter viridis]PYF06962.1 GH35 family endo-1,4-beta-xylanase [Rhodobacter viridis]